LNESMRIRRLPSMNRSIYKKNPPNWMGMIRPCWNNGAKRLSPLKAGTGENSRSICESPVRGW
jgi:hypothetical protein